MKIYSQDSSNIIAIDGFQPILGATYSGATTVPATIAVRLGADVSIAISGVSVAYEANELLTLRPGTTYTFGTATPVHIMYL